MRRAGNAHAHRKVENNSPFMLRLGLQASGVALSDMPVRYALVLEANYARLGQIWLDDFTLNSLSCSCRDPGS